MTHAHDPTARPEAATLANWRTPPYSRWAFRHVDRLVRSAGIAHDPDDVRVLQHVPRSLASFRLALSGGTTLDLPTFLQATATDTLVVLQRGRVAYEFYADGDDADSPHILMSISKSIVGLIVGILVRDGALDVDGPVSNVMPEIAGTAYRDATIRQLLDMRTGIRLDEGQVRAYAASNGWNPSEPGLRGGLHAFFLQLTGAAAVPHGGSFHYVSANTDLLGLAIERATGRSFASLVSELLWKPVGAAQDAYVTTDLEGAPRCTGGIGATALDLARIGQLMIEDGRRANRGIVPQSWIDDILRGGDRDAWRAGEWGESFAPLSRDMSYRSGWYVTDDAPQTLFGLGIHGQHLFVDRTNELVIVKFSSQGDATDYRAIGLTHRAVAAIRRCLTEG